MTFHPSVAEAATRVAVIGCGDISALHLAALDVIPGVELVAVCDTDPGRLAATAEQWGVPGFGGIDELLDAVVPDAVHVCTPHVEHAPMAIAALDRGVHVVLEKPLATGVAEGRALVEAAERSTAKLAVCFQNRYNEPVQRAKEVLESGVLGPVAGAAATVVWHRTPEYYEASPWRGRWETAGGGLLMNQAIHTLDLVQWLVGDVVGVTGGVATRALGDTIEVEDTADLVLTHASGARSVFYATLAHVANETVTVDIVAERGHLSLRGDLTVTYADGTTEVVAEPVTASGERAYWGISHQTLISDFYAGIRSEEPFWIGADEALKTLEIIQTVYDQTFPERLLAGAASTGNASGGGRTRP
ncbi:dehydrogenase [Frondihabitans sucicola]|uniref:Dehydrogenase n=1 Tax=Frondihabitans sucicola TaxID=1268041 RepID=A0ABN6XWS3_9MICO|nr:Gfo/Idh/MocA family oxidoreductase [Frondihabitans sucicola]BDZ49361.1 dehydrogenase [Frondihabitans sucicola]